MSRWFRHYAGLCRDEKLVSVAIKSRQTVERVVWIWAAILESAAEIDDGGRYALDPAEIAYFLRADEDHVRAVENALVDMGRLADGAVVKWGNRQFSSDRSKDRVAAHRERKRAQLNDCGVGEASRDGDVTLQERHCNSPETETETDTPVANATGAVEPPALSLVDQLWTDGVKTLISIGQREDRARSMVGKWMKDTGSDAGRVLWAIGEAAIHGTGDPIPYITRVLSDRATSRAPPPRQAKRNTALDDLNDRAEGFFANVQHLPRIAG